MVLPIACAKDPAVATVNGESIPVSELKRQVRVFQSVRPGAQDDAGTRRLVLDQLIKQRLLVQAARQSGIDKDAKVQSVIAERRQGLRAELEKSIADAQAQLLSLDEAVEARSLIEAYSQAQRVKMTVSEKDLQEAYRAEQAKGRALPPMTQMRDQLLEQVILDRLVDSARKAAKVEVHAEALP